MTENEAAARKHKAALNQALLETIEENRTLVAGLFAEKLEDVALKRAIREGQRTRKVSKQKIASLLSSAHGRGDEL